MPSLILSSFISMTLWSFVGELFVLLCFFATPCAATADGLRGFWDGSHKIFSRISLQVFKCTVVASSLYCVCFFNDYLRHWPEPNNLVPAWRMCLSLVLVAWQIFRILKSSQPSRRKKSSARYKHKRQVGVLTKICYSKRQAQASSTD
jgi:hypothetical protein